MRTVKFAQAACREMREAEAWYSDKMPSLGARFLDEMDSTLERIRLNPHLYPIVAPGIRRIQMNRFPFSVFYTLEADLLLIVRLFHQRRKSIEW